jgi:hypothetical protein
VAVLLNALGDPGQAYAFELEPGEADAASLRVPFEGVPAGDYLVRLRVDGAESRLQPDPAPPGAYATPRVTLVPGQPVALVASIAFETGGADVVALVSVQDLFGNPVPGAHVSGRWTRSNGRTESAEDDTGSDGLTHQLSILATHNPVSFTVQSVVKAGYRFDPDRSTLTQLVTP